MANDIEDVSEAQTAWALGLGIPLVGLLSYEAYAVVKGKPTLTKAAKVAIEQYPPAAPLIAFGFGALFGHIFWSK